MANVDSPLQPLTVNLPGDLIEKLEVLARYRQVSLDEHKSQRY